MYNAHQHFPCHVYGIWLPWLVALMFWIVSSHVWARSAIVSGCMGCALHGFRHTFQLLTQHVLCVIALPMLFYGIWLPWLVASMFQIVPSHVWARSAIVSWCMGCVLHGFRHTFQLLTQHVVCIRGLPMPCVAFDFYGWLKQCFK
jgi:hypothetical protein